MEHLYAPWRQTYHIENRDKSRKCVFCDISTNLDMDEDNQVLYRDDICFIVMNRYPYTPGHFMVIPHLHTAELEELPTEHFKHISYLVQKGVSLLKNEMRAGGVNIGMNLGVQAGAGIAEHIHYHLVPRWSGDTNFITTISDTRVYGSEFQDVYERLKAKARSYFK